MHYNFLQTKMVKDDFCKLSAVEELIRSIGLSKCLLFNYSNLQSDVGKNILISYHQYLIDIWKNRVKYYIFQMQNIEPIFCLFFFQINYCFPSIFLIIINCCGCAIFVSCYPSQPSYCTLILFKNFKKHF